MKKILFSAAMMIAAVSFANAQWFVGGAVGYGLSTTDLGNDNKNKVSSYELLPKVGYILNDNWMFGLEFGYEGMTNKDIIDGGDNVLNSFSDFFVINPYARYTAWTLGDFSLAFEGAINLGFGNDKAFDYGVNVAPVLQYDLTPCVMLESRMNFAALSFGAQQRGEGDAKTTDSQFGFGVNGNGADDTGSISLGFIVKF